MMLSIIKLRFMKLKDEMGVMILMMAMSIGFAFLTGMASNADYRPTVLLVDESKDRYSSLLVNELNKNQHFIFEEDTYVQAVDTVDRGKALAAVIIHKGFEDVIKSGDIPTLGVVKLKDDVELFTLQNLLSSITGKMIGDIRIARITADYISDNSSQSVEWFNKTYDKVLEHWRYRKPLELDKKIIHLNNSLGYDNAKHGIIGFSLFFVMYTIVFAIGEILNERKYNTWQRLIVSPISRISILGGNLIISFLIGFIQIILLFGVGHYGFGIDFGNSILGIITIAAVFVFAITCLGLFLSGLVKTHAQLGAVAPIILTSLGMLGGSMWPLDIVQSKILLILANISPVKWAVQGMEQIAMYGAGFDAVYIPSLVLFMMGFFFFGLGVKLVKF